MSYSKSLLLNLLKEDSYEVEEQRSLLDDYNEDDNQNDNTDYDNIEIIVDNSSQENHNLNIPQKKYVKNSLIEELQEGINIVEELMQLRDETKKALAMGQWSWETTIIVSIVAGISLQSLWLRIYTDKVTFINNLTDGALDKITQYNKALKQIEREITKNGNAIWSLSDKLYDLNFESQEENFDVYQQFAESEIGSNEPCLYQMDGNQTYMHKLKAVEWMDNNECDIGSNWAIYHCAAQHFYKKFNILPFEKADNTHCLELAQQGCEGSKNATVFPLYKSNCEELRVRNQLMPELTKTEQKLNQDLMTQKDKLPKAEQAFAAFTENFNLTLGLSLGAGVVGILGTILASIYASHQYKQKKDTIDKVVTYLIDPKKANKLINLCERYDQDINEVTLDGLQQLLLAEKNDADERLKHRIAFLGGKVKVGTELKNISFFCDKNIRHKILHYANLCPPGCHLKS